jgi:hypothetical protein
MMVAERKITGSGDDVGDQHVFEQRDFVAQLQFAFLEALQLNHIDIGHLAQRVDRGIKVAVVTAGNFNARPDFNLFHAVRSSDCQAAWRRLIPTTTPVAAAALAQPDNAAASIKTQAWTSAAVRENIIHPSQCHQPGWRRRETSMANAHLASLTARHALLDETVTTETRRPHPDQARLARLKREKLKLKEEIERFH